jgi:response regulator RpfG family c-di-GMP phosphodiesterase
MANVLLVGHEIVLATLVRWQLEADGHAVIHAHDGDGALGILRTETTAMIVILLTTRPHVNTVGILEAALQEPAVQRHAFILVTGLPKCLPEQWRELIDALGIPLLAKPGGITEVRRIVAETAARLQFPAPRCETSG